MSIQSIESNPETAKSDFRIHQHRSGLCISGLIDRIATQSKSFWLVDMIAGYQKQLAESANQHWRLAKIHSCKGVLSVDTFENQRIFQEEIFLVNFPYNLIQLDLVRNEVFPQGLLLLNSEVGSDWTVDQSADV